MIPAAHRPRTAGDFPPALVRGILIASVCYLSLLGFINARGFNISPAMVGLFEALIFATCLFILRRQLPLSVIALSFCTVAWIVLTWLLRQGIDMKSLRDLLIPLLFLSLGRHVADVGFADRSLKWIIGIVTGIALFEVLFINSYATLFNSFTFYRNISGVSEAAASFKGQMLSLNGYRPEGIGRTILPILFGSHRASSVFLEPIALGNFAVITLAWGLSKSWTEIRQSPAFILSAGLLITLCDSRFGMLMTATLIACRTLPLALINRLAPTFPLLILSLLLGLAWLAPSMGDNLHGRITTSGLALLHFDSYYLLGLGAPLPSFADMGYAYLLSRFGVPLCLALIAVIFLIPMPSAPGQRFRSMIVLYIFANLAISGTSVFALKTAGILWFLFGVLSLAGTAHPQPAKSAAPRQPDFFARTGIAR